MRPVIPEASSGRQVWRKVYLARPKLTHLSRQCQDNPRDDRRCSGSSDRGAASCKVVEARSRDGCVPTSPPACLAKFVPSATRFDTSVGVSDLLTLTAIMARQLIALRRPLALPLGSSSKTLKIPWRRQVKLRETNLINSQALIRDGIDSSPSARYVHGIASAEVDDRARVSPQSRHALDCLDFLVASVQIGLRDVCLVLRCKFRLVGGERGVHARVWSDCWRLGQVPGGALR